jgi:hypothetical protein
MLERGEHNAGAHAKRASEASQVILVGWQSLPTACFPPLVCHRRHMDAGRDLSCRQPDSESECAKVGNVARQVEELDGG